MLPLLGILGVVVKPIANIVGNWQKKRLVKQEGEIAIAQAKVGATIKRLQTGQEADIAWETLSIKGAGWKDEWFTIVLSIPAILVFVPGMADYVYKGFEALKNCPQWYQWALLVAVASSFGYKKIADFMALKKGA